MLKQSFLIFSSKLVGYGVRLALPYVLVRMLSVADFGSYRQFFLLEMYIGSLFQLGLNQALYYFVPRDPRNAGSYFVTSLLANAAVFTLVFAALGPFAGPIGSWLHMPVLKDAFWQLCCYVVLLMLTVGCDCYLTASRKVKAAAAFEIAGQLLVSVLCVAAAVATRSLTTILAGLVVARAIQLVAMLAYIHWVQKGFRAEQWFRGFWSQVRYGVVLGAAGTLVALLMRFHEFFVSRYYGPEGYAVYSAGCSDLPLVQMFTQSLAVVALGQFAALEQRGDWDGIRELWRRVLASSCAVVIPVVLVMVVAARPLVLFMFTDEYAGAVDIFRINTVLKLGFILNATLVLRAVSRNDVSIWIQVISLVLAPVLLYAGMKFAGMMGIIAAQAVLMIGSRLAAVVVMNRIIPQHLPLTVGAADILGFYRETWRGARARLATAGRRHG